MIIGQDITSGNSKIVLGEEDASNKSGCITYNRTNGTIDLRISGSTDPNGLYVKSSGLVGIGQTAPTGQLEVYQPSSTGAKPVLVLDQQDTDQHFIEFKTATIYTGKTAADEYLKVKTPGGDRYIKLYS